MKRRQFIRILGGGIVVAAGGALTTGSASASASASTALQGNPFPAIAVKPWVEAIAHADPRRFALAHALLAPNAHNRQPWMADLGEPNAIGLRVDPTRLLPETDPFNRQIVVSMGAFIELLVMALAEKGFAAEVTLFPLGEYGAVIDATESRLLARIVLSAGGTRDPLFPHIVHRHTNKKPFDLTRPVSAATTLALARSVRDTGVRFGASLESGEIAVLRALATEALRIEMATPRTSLESIKLLRIGAKQIAEHRDGISMTALPMRLLDTFGMVSRTEAPKPGSYGFDSTLERFSQLPKTAMGFVWLATPGNARSQQIAAGRAYVRLQLEATRMGLGMHPLSQALQEFPEMAASYGQIHRRLAKPGETLQMFCRIGYAPPIEKIPATPRRDLQSFVRV